MIVFERRASAILFNVIQTLPLKGPVLLPANICPIVPILFYKAGRPFEFIDVAPHTMCIDHNKVIERWTRPRSRRPAGIVYVRSYGAMFETSDLFAVLKSLSPDAIIVDDRCLCPPDFSAALAPHADIALYSTGYAKYVDIGFGGFGIVGENVTYTRSESAFRPSDLDGLTERYKDALRTKTRYSYIDCEWMDLTPPPESLAAYQERVAQELIRISPTKKAINAIYSARLSPEIQFPDTFQSWRFNIKVDNKAAVLDAIERAGLFASGHYQPLAGIFGPGNAPVAEAIHDHVVNLFNDRYFSLEQAVRLTDLLAGFEPPSDRLPFA